MPTYEYECAKCGKVFEVFQSIRERPKRWLDSDCKPCKCNAPVSRLIGAGAGIIFKGSGFYQTDYRSEAYKKAAKAEKEASTDKSNKESGSKSGKTKDKVGECKAVPPKAADSGVAPVSNR